MQGGNGKHSKSTRQGVSRRGFLKSVGVVGVGAVLADPSLLHAADDQPAAPAASSKTISGPVDIVLNLNGQDRKVTVEPRTTLLNALRNNLDPPLTGPKLVCDMGTCGCCTVLLNDNPVYGCLLLAIDAVGKKITTVEGIGTPENLSPLQAAFGEHDAMMCGYCTDGFITSLTGLLKANPNPTESEVREACKGNFCRCGTYPRIFQAALQAAKARA